MSSGTDVVTGEIGEDASDPTFPAPMTNVAEYGFEGRFEDWADDARYFEYSKAANPIGSGHISHVPIKSFGADLYLDGPTRVIPLDLSTELGINGGPATSPALVAHFVRIRAGEQIATSPNATSQLYYVIGGRGFSAVNGRLARWEKGDFLTLPANSRATFYADSSSDAAMYWVHDEPLLRHLGQRPPNHVSAQRNSAALTQWPGSMTSHRAQAQTTRAGSASCWPMRRRSRH